MIPYENHIFSIIYQNYSFIDFSRQQESSMLQLKKKSQEGSFVHQHPFSVYN